MPIIHRQDGSLCSPVGPFKAELIGGRLKPSCTDLVNTGGRKIEVIGPLLEEEGMAVFAGFDFRHKRERHQ